MWAMSGDHPPGYAHRIIDKFGGVAALAAALKEAGTTIYGRQTVMHWKTVGHIPAQRHADVLRAARQKGVELAPEDFFDRTNDAAA